MTAYYNEFDPYAAQWLRNLIAAGYIAPGVVDERSIEDVVPSDLGEFTQCHFFAGIGVWSLALRRAGWADDRPVWTGSCPCQPFSAAGAQAGFSDPRHLWPTFAWLIKQRRPPIVFGEQVASKAVEPWVDLVHADMEALGYAFGCIPFPSAGVGAPHIRDRAYWVANSNDSGLEGRRELSSQRTAEWPTGASGVVGRVANSQGDGYQWPGQLCESTGRNGPAHMCSASRVGHTESMRRQGECLRAGSELQASGASQAGDLMRPGPVNGFWRAADGLFCRDEKWRPVEPGTFPMVARPSAELGRVQPGLGRIYGRNRTGRLKGYGNAINAEAARVFIEAMMECQP